MAEFFWMVQPDGRYWEDEDGFGAEKNIEITLLAKFDKNGKFVTKFQEKKKFKNIQKRIESELFDSLNG